MRSASVKRPAKTTNLGHILKRWRMLDDLGMREAAKQIGIGASTLCRLEMGHKPDSDTWLIILNWLARSR